MLRTRVASEPVIRKPLVDFLDCSLASLDTEIAEVVGLVETEGQQPGLANQQALGDPGHFDDGDCEWIDLAERMAADRARRVFEAEHANLRPRSARQANAAAYHALLEPGDTVLGFARAHGGLISPMDPSIESGLPYELVAYGVDRQTSLIDMDEVERIALEHRPRLILAGWSAYPRVLDFPRFRAIADEVGAYLLVDMSHFAGLVAAGLHPNPVPFADVVTTTINKTLGGTRGGMILSTERLAERIAAYVHAGPDSAVLANEIAGKAVTLGLAASDPYRERQERALAGARAVAGRLLAGGHGAGVLTGGTDVHLVLCDLRDSAVDGLGGEARLAAVGITVARVAMPFDPRPHVVSSGLRIGTQALAGRGLQIKDFAELGAVIADALNPYGFADRHSGLADRAAAIVDRYPLYSRSGEPAASQEGVVVNFPRRPLPPAAVAAG